MGRAAITLLFVAIVLFARPAAADEPSAPAEAGCTPGWESSVFLAARASVVRISDGQGWGAGFAWKSPTRIVTAMHVVARARSFEIVFADGGRGRARLVAGDRSSDVAILELEGQSPRLVPLDLGEPSLLALGAPVIAIGHPLARDQGTDRREEGLRTWTVTRGVLGARNDHQIQVDAPLNPGNSGGPVLDCKGRVIGVASHVSGSLGFASAPREILELETNPHIPGISFAPTGVTARLGASLRVSDFGSYGPLLEADVAFFEAVRLTAHAAGLFSLTAVAQGDRVITSRAGLHLYAGAGYAIRVWQSISLVPHLGVASFNYRENAFTFVNGQAANTSRSRASLRFTPGLAITTPLVLDYKLEIDGGSFRDSAHIVSTSFAF